MFLEFLRNLILILVFDIKHHIHHFWTSHPTFHTQTIEQMRRSVKFRNKESGTARDFIDLYLADYMWKTRFLFRAILEDIASFWPPA